MVNVNKKKLLMKKRILFFKQKHVKVQLDRVSMKTMFVINLFNIIKFKQVIGPWFTMIELLEIMEQVIE